MRILFVSAITLLAMSLSVEHVVAASAVVQEQVQEPNNISKEASKEAKVANENPAPNAASNAVPNAASNAVPNGENIQNPKVQPSDITNNVANGSDMLKGADGAVRILHYLNKGIVLPYICYGKNGEPVFAIDLGGLTGNKEDAKKALKAISDGDVKALNAIVFNKEISNQSDPIAKSLSQSLSTATINPAGQKSAKVVEELGEISKERYLEKNLKNLSNDAKENINKDEKEQDTPKEKTILDDKFIGGTLAYKDGQFSYEFLSDIVEMESVHKEIMATQQEIAGLNSQINAKSKKIQGPLENIAKIEKERDAIKSELDEMKKKNPGLSKEDLEKKTKQKEELMAALKVKEDAVTAAQAALAKARAGSQKTAAQKTLTAATTACDDLKKSTDDQIAAIQKQIDDASGPLKALEEKLAAKEKELADASASPEIAKSKPVIDALKDDIKELQVKMLNLLKAPKPQTPAVTN